MTTTTGHPSPTVLISENLLERMPTLGERFPDVTFVELPLEGGELRPEYCGAHAMFRSAMSEDLFDDILRNAPDLAWVQIAAAGFDWMGGDVLAERVAGGMVTTRSESSLNVTIAEYCIGAMLSAARRLPDYFEAQQRSEWARYMGRDFIGSTVAIFGTGAIGREVAWRVAALGATPIGVSRSGAPAGQFERVITSDQFHTVLPEADYVVLAMPLTPETENMFGSTEFELMPEHAVLVNIGRGALTDEAALVEALESGQIASAFVDVFVEEPLPTDNPMWTTKNLVVTPHTSFRSDGNGARLERDFVGNLERFIAGDPLAGTMSHPELGY
ncbi:MAG: D-2-hydroxyacid dehydrogenase [Ilumatobacter fluminis]|uniref:D-2-hydroxyacid dehydrogenase n=1 Tax=Ilumatobacter fluminis TaxID=467091 RepID=UPI0032EAD380